MANTPPLACVPSLLRPTPLAAPPQAPHPMHPHQVTSPTPTLTITVLQHNLGRSRNAHDELRQIAADLRVDVALLQEPYSIRDFIPSFGVTTRSCFTAPNPMSAILTFNTHLSTTYTTVQALQTPIGSLLLISQYYQHSHPIQPYLTQLRRINPSVPHGQSLIAADLNASSPKTRCVTPNGQIVASRWLSPSTDFCLWVQSRLTNKTNLQKW